MSILIVLAAALLPATLLWIYIWKQDPQPEPTNWLLKAVLYGVVIFIPVGILETAIKQVLLGGEPTTVFGTTIMAFFVAAIPEESFKLLALWLVLRKNPYFDEHFDGIVYAVCVGLGFAAVENVLYVIGSQENWFSVAIARSLLAVPGHFAFGVMMGYYYSVYHFVDHSPRTAACVLLIPILAHGVYDTLALSGLADATTGSIAFIILIYFCIKMHKFAKKKIIAQIERDRNSYNA